ncbi:MAG: hypothetical protein NW223_18090 [Hyphomicrobiaceae bacterium]|nr:hypothetical protein [Hyphomicrobiaceae bacterium]
MFGDLIHRIEERRRRRLEAQADMQLAPDQDPVGQAKARAVATGAAIATSLDGSPAAVVGIYDYAHRWGDKARRTA